jgi:hypothetical protein
LPSAEDFGTSGDVADEYEDEVGCGLENSTQEINDSQYEIHESETATGGFRFKASFHVASAFFPIIIGKKGTTKKRIESDTKTRSVGKDFILLFGKTFIFKSEKI